MSQSLNVMFTLLMSFRQNTTKIEKNNVLTTNKEYWTNSYLRKTFRIRFAQKTG